MFHYVFIFYTYCIIMVVIDPPPKKTTESFFHHYRTGNSERPPHLHLHCLQDLVRPLLRKGGPVGGSGRLIHGRKSHSFPTTVWMVLKPVVNNGIDCLEVQDTGCNWLYVGL